MTEKYYVDISEELAEKLQGVDDEDITSALEKLADRQESKDELSDYDSVPEIMADESISEAERRRMKIRAERHPGISNR